MDDAIKQIGSNIFIKVSEFQGKKFVDIRKYYQKDDDWGPTRKGIAMNPDAWKEFVANIADIDQKVQEILGG